MGLIKKYETGELIGTGSMGSVYRARDIVLEREVALKILHSRGDLDPELKERFYREARTGANLRHPNVVVVYELDEHNGVPFIAMELLNGIDGRHYISERRAMSLAQKVELFAQICDGLAEAHRRGVVHRDVKPSNIFICDDGTAKILDFGIARVASSKLTIAGKVLGTPNYMAPEQINRRRCDSRSDLFSVAIVFFELLVYSHPFRSSFIPRRIVDDDPDTLFERDPLIPQSLADLLYKALQKLPESRIQTAEEFAAGLRAVLQELRTGLATEPVIQSVSLVPLPDPTPSSTGNPDSPDGRLAGFVQMLSDFDAAARIGDLVSARTIVADMARLEAEDPRFSEALRECRDKLERLQASARPVVRKEAQPATRTATAGAGGSTAASTAEAPTAPPGSNGSTSGSEASGPWENDQSIFDDRTIKGGEDVQGRWNPETSDGFNLVCRACGESNREAATYCHSCGIPIERTRQSSPRIEAPARRNFGEKVAEVRTEMLQKTEAGIQVVSDNSRRLWAWVSALPRRTHYAIGGVLVVCGLAAIALLFTVGPLRPVPVYKALGVATVKAAQTALLEAEAPSSKQLSLLQRGTPLNVLTHLANPSQRLVRVQLVQGNKAYPPGFVALADLGQWTSNDPAVAWEYLGLRRPGPTANDEQLRQFAEDLGNFSGGFPSASLSRIAALEHAALCVGLVEQARAAGKDSSQWQRDLDTARGALAFATSMGELKDPGEKELRTKLESLSTEEEPGVTSGGGPQTPGSLGANAEIDRLIRASYGAWNDLDDDKCIDYCNKVLAIDPNNQTAKNFLIQIPIRRRNLR